MYSTNFFSNPFVRRASFIYATNFGTSAVLGYGGKNKKMIQWENVSCHYVLDEFELVINN